VKPDSDELLIICLPVSRGNPGGFDDNVYGPCADCGVEIQWRPHAPAGRHVCMNCAARTIEKEGITGSITMTPEIVEEIRRHIALEKATKKGGVG